MHSLIEDVPEGCLKPGDRLYKGDFNPGRNALIIRCARVRNVHSASLVLETGDGSIETIALDNMHDHGWERTEYHALQKLQDVLHSRVTRLESGMRRAQEMMQAYGACGVAP